MYAVALDELTPMLVHPTGSPKCGVLMQSTFVLTIPKYGQHNAGLLMHEFDP